MRRLRYLLVLPGIFFFCFTFLIPVLAQEKLPEIVKKIKPSTVVILTYDNEGKPIGQGSGFFISKNGDIITNEHVLAGAARAEVKTVSGKVYPITMIVAEDKEADIVRASVDIPAESVYPLLVSSSVPEEGEQVVVIGNPLGFEQTVSEGIVSAVREIPAFGKIYQITAPISPGSSGSPVINMNGEIIGIATFQSVEGQNLNFAIPNERITKLKAGKGRTLNEWSIAKAEDGLDSAEGLFSAGLVFFLADDYEKALSYFEKVGKKNPRYAETLFQIIGYCYYKLGRYQEAIDAYKQAIRIKPYDAIIHHNLGMAYVVLSRHTEAIDAFKQAIRIKPDYAEAYGNLGMAYAGLGRYQEAIDAYKQAIRINSDNALMYCGLGLAYGNLGRDTEAVDAYKQAIRIKPDLAFAHSCLGDAYGSLKRWEEAIDAYKQAIRLEPDHSHEYLMLGLAYGCISRYPEAIDAFKQAIRIKPDDADAHYQLGFAYLCRDDKGSALNQYKILKELDDDLANKLFNQIYK